MRFLQKNDEPLKKYRHEYKYIVTDNQLAIIESRLRNVVSLDSHVNKEGVYKGVYNIRSLYFDTITNRCFYENENGTDPREKFRIRIYNHSNERISLELKQKVNGKCRKLSCQISEEQCRILMSGGKLQFREDYPAILKKLWVQMETELLHPVVIVEYDRTPFVYVNGNVRITFDMNIRSSSITQEFLNDELPERLIMPAGQHILEVKWDEFLPDFIYHSIDLNNLQWTAFSKYYICRKYALGYTSLINNTVQEEKV